MATRPTDTLTWGGTQVDPGEAQKAAGYSPGDEPPAEWINYFQALAAEWVGYFDEVVSAEYEVPLLLDERKVEDGTWTIGTYGTLSESTNLRECVVPIRAPVGTTIVSLRVRGSHASGAGDNFGVVLIGVTATSTITEIGNTGVSDNGTATEQDVLDPLDPHLVLPNTRYYARIFTTGGGSGARLITGAWVGLAHG
jgi:hypothetical protein